MIKSEDYEEEKYKIGYILIAFAWNLSYYQSKSIF